MDEASRHLERAASTGDDTARVKLANEKLRAGDPKAALSLLDEARPTSGLHASFRALALKRLDEEREALLCLEQALAVGLRDLEANAALEALKPSLTDPVALLGKARAARILSRIAVPNGALSRQLDQLAVDDDRLVRLACLTDRPQYHEHDRTTRVYGSHGPDYKTGYFIVFEAPLELRLRTFDPEMFRDVERAFATISRDRAGGDTPDPFRAAFGDGYGLAGDAGPISLTERWVAMEEFARLDVLPFTLRNSPPNLQWQHRPYDLMGSEKKLARRLGRDLLAHPARQRAFNPDATLMERFLALHPLKGDPAPPEKIAPLLEEAQTRYTKTGVRALEEFRNFLKGAERGFF